MRLELVTWIYIMLALMHLWKDSKKELNMENKKVTKEIIGFISILLAVFVGEVFLGLFFVAIEKVLESAVTKLIQAPMWFYITMLLVTIAVSIMFYIAEKYDEKK